MLLASHKVRTSLPQQAVSLQSTHVRKTVHYFYTITRPHPLQPAGKPVVRSPLGSSVHTRHVSMCPSAAGSPKKAWAALFFTFIFWISTEILSTWCWNVSLQHIMIVHRLRKDPRVHFWLSPWSSYSTKIQMFEVLPAAVRPCEKIFIVKAQLSSDSVTAEPCLGF